MNSIAYMWYSDVSVFVQMVPCSEGRMCVYINRMLLVLKASTSLEYHGGKKSRLYGCMCARVYVRYNNVGDNS